MVSVLNLSRRNRSNPNWGVFVCRAIWLLVWLSCLPSGSSQETGGAGRVEFPLRASEDGRTLVDAAGRPFILRGRTAWYVISQPVEMQEAFLNDCVSKGFNAIEMKGITHDKNGNRPPFAGNGEVPFEKRLNGQVWDGTLSGAAADFNTPNERYWSYLDRFLDACEQRGIVVLLFPAYVGYGGGEQGWMQEMVKNGPDRLRYFGKWITKRYRSRGNLIWMIGGDYADFNEKELIVERALIEGMKSDKSQASTLYSAEWLSNIIGSAHPQLGGEVNFNGVYSWENSIALLSRRAYMHSPAMPAFLLEEPYDEEGPDGNNYNPNATQPVRRFIYWGWLNTIGGYMAGNGYVWRFNQDWESHLDSRGAHDLQHLNELIESVEAWRLVPSGQDGMRELVPAGSGPPDALDYIAAAATRQGDLLLAYVSPGCTQPFVIDVRQLTGPIMARWFDPTTGEYRAIGMIDHTQPHTFEPPGVNGGSDRDWVLRLDAKPSSK